jgi:hypothetical protein
MNAISTGLILCAAGLSANAGDIQRAGNGRMLMVHGCWGDEHGNLEGGRFLVPTTIDAGEPESLDGFAGRGTDADNRIDLVIVGDGYTASEMGLYNLDADRIANDFFRYEPFIRYEPYFRVTKVEVVSNESGVDNDPDPGISRDTAMDMRYWCSDIERLLCVSVSKARSFAFAGAPDVDQILAIANSSKYGGAGYSSSDVGTAAGQNSAAVEIAIHEMGHSLGNLADEYTYGGPTNYAGGEPNSANLSTLNATQMAAAETKWHRWLNDSTPGFDSPVSTYEGGGYSENGIYRPSNNSMMRALSRPFNLPGAEKLIREFYREVSPIDAGPASGASFAVGESAMIVPLRPNGQPLRVDWIVGGEVVLTGQDSVTAGELSLPAGPSIVEVRVTDDTPWVRDEAVRANDMTESRVYSMTGCAAYADLNADRVLDLADITVFVDAFTTGLPPADVAAPFGVFDLSDIIAFVDAFGAGCR